MTGRLAIVLDHPVQHFAPSFRELARSRVADCSVVYWSAATSRVDRGFGRLVEWDRDLLSGYEWWAPNEPGLLRRTVETVRHLRRLRPTVVLCYGWGSTVARVVIAWSFITRTPFLLYGDSTWQHSGRRLLRPIRNVLLRVLFRVAAGAVSTGTFNRDFYVGLGMSPAAITAGVCPTDVASFVAARAARPYNGAGPVVIGFAGKLTHRKGVDIFLHALARLPPDHAWVARIVGEGPEREALSALATELGIADRLEWFGFRNASEIPKVLASLDIVVVPSRRDLRVLVTQEAMAAGAAVIVSSATAVWGPGDLVEDGTSGFVFDNGDPADLAAKLLLLLDQSACRTGLAAEGARRAEQHGPQQFVASVEVAIARIARRPTGRRPRG